MFLAMIIVLVLLEESNSFENCFGIAQNIVALQVYFLQDRHNFYFVNYAKLISD